VELWSTSDYYRSGIIAGAARCWAYHICRLHLAFRKQPWWNISRYVTITQCNKAGLLTSWRESENASASWQVTVTGLRRELRVWTSNVDGYVINTTADTSMLGFHWNQWLRRIRRGIMFVVENPIWDSDFYRHFFVLYCEGSIRFVTDFAGICEGISRMQMK
jgi:hypothetical protein